MHKVDLAFGSSELDYVDVGFDVRSLPLQDVHVFPFFTPSALVSLAVSPDHGLRIFCDLRSGSQSEVDEVLEGVRGVGRVVVGLVQGPLSTDTFEERVRAKGLENAVLVRQERLDSTLVSRSGEFDLAILSLVPGSHADPFLHLACGRALLMAEGSTPYQRVLQGRGAVVFFRADVRGSLQANLSTIVEKTALDATKKAAYKAALQLNGNREGVKVRKLYRGLSLGLSGY